MMYIIDLCLQGEEFDAVKPLMADSVRFKGQMWFHANFWARCRKRKKIKRFFAEDPRCTTTTSHPAAALAAQTCHILSQELRSHSAAAPSARTYHFQSQKLRSHPAAVPSARTGYFQSQFPLLKHAPSSVCIYVILFIC